MDTSPIARSSLPLPALRGERAGVRGSLHKRERVKSPPHPDRIVRCDPTSPRGRGEVENENKKTRPVLPDAFLQAVSVSTLL
jgi:hypothetical protein